MFDPSIDKLPLNDSRTWNMIGTGNTKGVFQLESKLGQSKARQIKPRSIEELAHLLSVIRPGCLDATIDDKSLTQHFIDRRNGEEVVEYLHPALEPILAPTYGILVYQEQAMEIAKNIAGFDLQEADTLRKCITGDCTFRTRFGGKVSLNELLETPEESLPEVLTVDEHNRLQYKKIKKVWYTKDSPTLTIKLTNGYNITVTPEHQIATTWGWMRACDLNCNKAVIVYIKGSSGIVVCGVDEIVVNSEPVPVYDYQMVDESTPYAFVNDILAHNSIGKKDVRLMHKVESKFIEGCEKQGIVDKETARQLFEWIKASQRYSFNKSHAVSYALTAFQTAYVKAHYPLQFFTAYLRYAKYKPDQAEEISELINNARTMGIQVLPPRIERCNETFEIYDGNIAFGLLDIKGVGTKFVENFRELVKRHQPSTFYQYMMCADFAGGKRDVVPLIESGAFDKFTSSRHSALYQYDIYRQLSKKDRTWLLSCQHASLRDGLIALAEEIENNPRRKRHAYKVYGFVSAIDSPPYNLHDTPSWIAQKERDLLGVTLTAHEIDGKATGTTTCTCLEYADTALRHPKSLSIAARLDKLNEYKTKRGDMMAFLTISDNTCRLDNISLLPQIYEQYKNILHIGDSYLFVGDHDKKFNSFSVKDIRILV